MKKVLLVDDFNISNEIVSKVLTNYGFEVHCVQSVNSAISIAEKIQFDIIITDYNMPKSNGIELVKKFRADPKYLKTPIFMLSSSNDQAVKNLAFETKITAWLQKPINPEQLKNLIDKVLR